MKNFIEVTNTDNVKELLNVNYIFKTDVYTDKKIKGRIFMSPRGHNNYPVQVVYTLETYEEIKQLIGDSF